MHVSERYGELPYLLLNELATGDSSTLEAYLMDRSGLPGQRMNLELAAAFARCLAEIVQGDDPPVEALERLLDGWAAIPAKDAPVNDPRMVLPACAVLAYGYVGAARPDWWEDEIGKLRRAAADDRWRMREMAATGLQQMLAAEWDRTFAELRQWVSDANPLVVRAAAAAVAEPGLLVDAGRAGEALSLQREAVRWISGVFPDQRRDEDVRVLRQALGYSLSVCTAAAPEAGFALLHQLAELPEADVRWIVRENLRKNRLARWLDQVESVRASMRE